MIKGPMEFKKKHGNTTASPMNFRDLRCGAAKLKKILGKICFRGFAGRKKKNLWLKLKVYKISIARKRLYFNILNKKKS